MQQYYNCHYQQTDFCFHGPVQTKKPNRVLTRLGSKLSSQLCCPVSGAAGNQTSEGLGSLVLLTKKLIPMGRPLSKSIFPMRIIGICLLILSPEWG